VPSFQMPVPRGGEFPEARGMRRVGAPGLQGEFSGGRGGSDGS
jgi:hypothetical protein